MTAIQPTVIQPSVIQPDEAESPLVLAIDVGTSSARALVYDSLGRMIAGLEGRTAYQMATTPDGGVEIDADLLLKAVLGVIDEVARAAGGLLGKVLSVALCTFWHSVIGVDQDGTAVTPLYNWSDTRSR